MRKLAILLGLAVAATPALAFRAENGMTVKLTGPTEFAVAYRFDREHTDYWCAAGDFAIRALGLPRTTRIYRVTPPPRKAGQGVTFSLDPANGTAETGISSFGDERDSKSISAGVAEGAYCFKFDIIPFN